MANSTNTKNLDNTTDTCDREESSPLLSKNFQETDKKPTKPTSSPSLAEYGWTADGLPLAHGSLVGEPVGRSQWNSGLCSCFGGSDEFCSSDLEVCLLGSIAPCVLYGSNVERLGSTPGMFASHCLPYCALYLISKSFIGGNCLAPCFSYPSRTAIRRKFNLEGSCEALNRSCGCCGSCVEDDLNREQLETACDFATHVFCHPCALCQEGREIRRRMPHPGFNAQPVLATPMSTTTKLIKDEREKEVDEKLFRSMIGSLLYLTAVKIPLANADGFSSSPSCGNLHHSYLAPHYRPTLNK